ncbi:MAG: TolC family protein, partial [Phycisphaerales bacterium]|nr:TolC family protein [Phycisphaerales bacterium]
DATRARQAILALLGLPATHEVVFEGTTFQPPFPPEDGTEARLIRCNTEIAVERASYEVAEQSLRLEVRRQYPDLSIGAGYGRESGEDRLLLGLSIPVPLWNRNQGPIAEAEAARERARVSVETTFERLWARCAALTTMLEILGEQRAAYERDLLPMLDEQAADVERIASLGVVDVMVLLETVTRRSEALERVVEMRLDETRTRIELVELLGPDLDEDDHAMSSSVEGDVR